MLEVIGSLFILAIQIIMVVLVAWLVLGLVITTANLEMGKTFFLSTTIGAIEFAASVKEFLVGLVS